MIRHKMLVALGKVLLIFILCSHTISAGNNKTKDSTAPKIELSISPLIKGNTLSLKPDETSTKITLLVQSIAAKTPIGVRLEIEKIARKDGEDEATACFTKIADKKSNCKRVLKIQLNNDISFQSEVEIQIDNLIRNGTYTTVIKAIIVGNNSAAITETIKIKRVQIDFNPTISGGIVDDDKVVYYITNQENRSFSFEINNPPDGKTRNFKIANTKLYTTDNKHQLLIKFVLPQGQIAFGGKATVQAKIVGDIKASNYKGRFLIRDTNLTKYAWKEFPLRIERKYEIETFWTKWGGFMGVIAVIFGACISVFLNRAAPRTITRRQYQIRIEMTAERIERLRRIGDGSLNIRFSTERSQLKFQCKKSNFFLSQEEITKFGNRITALEQQIDVAEQLTQLAGHFETNAELPRMLIEEGRKCFRMANWHLINGDSDAAKEELTKAKALTFSNKNSKIFIEMLSESINRTKGLIDKDDNLTGLLKEHWTDLTTALTKFESGNIPNLKHLLELDRKYYTIYLFVDRYSNNILKRGTSDFVKEESELLKLLERGGNSNLHLAEKLVRDMDTGFLPRQIIERMKEKDNGVYLETVPIYPIKGQQTILTLNFGEPYDSSTAARELLYEWNFGNDENPVRGKRCAHFFSTDKDNYDITIHGLAPDGTWVLFVNNFTLSVKKPQKNSKKVTSIIFSIQAVVFIVSIFLAVLVVWLTHFDDFRADEWKDLLIPFLIGIGVDQFRDKTSGMPKIAIDKLVKPKSGKN